MNRADAPDRIFGVRHAPYACDPAHSRGRLHGEPECATRTVFQRDRDRIVHSTAFRRMKHKTQVFVSHEGDHYRTRLTHSLEVSNIARSVGRCLGLNEELAETLALAHDLGHTPFGHAGENALNDCMAAYGGFDHNAQTLRILTRLERKYAEFDGLNLTWETLEGVVKHNGPLVVSPTGAAAGPAMQPVPEPIADYVSQHDLELDTWPGLEAQVAALADDIAYNNHDLDDGLRAGLFTVAEVRRVGFVDEAFREVLDRYPDLEEPRLNHEANRRLISLMVDDLLAETRRRLSDYRPGDPDAVRRRGRATAAFSETMAANDRALKAFLYENMYAHPKVRRETDEARDVVRNLFGLFFDRPDRLPLPWRRRAEAGGEARRARVIADYIAGMTDRFALNEHDRLIAAER